MELATPEFRGLTNFFQLPHGVLLHSHTKHVLNSCVHTRCSVKYCQGHANRVGCWGLPTQSWLGALEVE
jgi:hypothetical protein